MHWFRVLLRSAQVVIGIAVLSLAVWALFSRQAALAALGLVCLALLVGFLYISHRDEVMVLTLMLALLFLVSEHYVIVGPLKSVGYPAQVVGLVALGLWCAGRIRGRLQAITGHPIRWIFLIYAVTALMSFAAGMTRTLTVQESAGAVRAIFPVAASIGIGLLAVDGLRTREHVEALLLRLVFIGGLAACVGILEFADHSFKYGEMTRLPGLTSNNEIIDTTRSGFARIDGAAAHPVEYAVALAALAPLALHFAIYERKLSRRRLAALSFLALLVVNPMTVSRSGLLALAVGFAIYAAHLSWRARLNFAILGILGLGLFRVAVPGLLGTLRSFFLVGEKDPSIAGRTEDYVQIPGLLAEYTWFGRGLGTFQPDSYFFLDNQYLGSLLEGGVICVTALIVIFVIGIGTARGVRHHSSEMSMRSLGQALAASLAVLAVCAGTFDELSFKQTTFLLFLLLGCAGALWSITLSQPKRFRSGKVRPRSGLLPVSL